MKRERRQPTRAEWEHLTSKRPVTRKIPTPDRERAIKPRKKNDKRR